MNRHAVFAAAAACFLCVAFTQNSEPANHGIVVANMDRSVKPGDDFYHYACGDWIRRTEIPPDSVYVSIGGYYLVEAQSADEALTSAGSIPWARYGSVEVRPIMAFS